MEEGRIVQETVGANPEVAMGPDLEEESGSKRSPSPKKETGLGRDEGAQKKKSQKRKQQEQTQLKRDQEKEKIQGEIVEQQRKERMLRKLKRTNALDPTLGLELAIPQLPSTEYKASCESGLKTESKASTVKSGLGQLNHHFTPAIKKLPGASR